MKPGGGRAKGHAFERWLAKDLRPIWPGAKRGLQSRGGGAEVPDVVIPHYHLEAKIGKLPSPRAALYQATRDAAPGMVPVAVIKDDRCAPFVVLSYAHWRALVAALHSGDSEGNPCKEIDR